MFPNDHVYKTVEITGTSTTTEEQAIQNAVAKASQSIRNMRWFQVVETRGAIDEGKVAQWQVTLKIGFSLEKQE
ncbi:MAG: dodecin domain-containing protein [Nitrospirales bacterium]|nr:dodecin domain-containing protein [Nitrospirales bacterium]